MMRVFIILALVLAACTGPEPRHDYATEVVPSDQIVRVGPRVDFLNIRSTASTGDGTWVLDRGEPYLTFIANDAKKEVIRFGLSGHGPAELRNPVAIEATHRGIDVWDVGREEVVSFDRSGRVTAARPLSRERGGWIRPDMAEVSYLDPWRVRRLANNVVYARFPDGLTHPGDAAAGALVSSRAQLGPGETLLDYGELIPAKVDVTSRFTAIPLWDACDDALVVWDPGRSEVRWQDAYGRDFAVVAVASPPPRVTEEGVVNFLRHMARLEIGPGFESADIDFTGMARDLRSEFGDRGPAFADLRCAARGVAWLQLFDMSDDPLGRGSTWIRVAQDAPPEAIVFPRHFRPTEFGGDRLLGADESAEGQTLSRWRITTRRTI